MGTGWELVRQRPLSRTQHPAATGCSPCPRAGPASALFATVARSDYETPVLDSCYCPCGSLPSFPLPGRWVREQGPAPPERLPGQASGRKLQNRTWGRKGLSTRSQAASGAATLATCPQPLCPHSRGRGNGSLRLQNPSSHGSDYRLSHPRREKAPLGVGRTPSHPADSRSRRPSARGDGPSAIPAVAAPWTGWGQEGSPRCISGTEVGQG